MNNDLQLRPQDLDTVLHLADVDLFEPQTLAHALDLLTQFAAPLVADVTTAEGRREIARTARAVGSAITRLDERRREYVAVLKAKPRAIDDLFRTTFRQPAELLRDRIKAPLDLWEEELRLADAQTDELIALLNAPIEHGTTAAAIGQRLEAARDLELPDWLSPTQRDTLAAAIPRNLPRLETALAAALAAEAQAAELERLRAVERDAALTRAREEAAEQAKRAADARAIMEVERAKARVLAAERDAALAGQARALEGARERAAQVDSSATQNLDIEHRKAIHRDVLADLRQVGIGDDDAITVLRSIATGKIRHITISYT